MRHVITRLGIVLVVLAVVVGVRFFAIPGTCTSGTTWTEISTFLDSWRIDVVSNDGELRIAVPGKDVRAERTPGLKQRWRDGLSIRGMVPEVRAEIVPTATGTVTVFLCGEYRFKNGRSLPQQVDYLSVEINGREVIGERTMVDYRHSKKIDITVQAGQRVKLRAQMAPHDYTLSEVRQLLTAWFGDDGKGDLDASRISLCRRLGIGGKGYWLMTNRRVILVFGTLFLSWLAFGFFISMDKWTWTYLGVLLLLLVTPLLFCTNETLSMTEKRRLAEVPHFWEKGQINTKFLKGFEEWFNDHFGSRSAMLGAYTWINRHFNSVVAMGPGRWNKRTGWVFKAGGIQRPTVDSEGIETLVRFRDWLHAKDISLYLVLVPNKERIYAQEAWSVGVALDRHGLADWRCALEGVLGNRLILPEKVLTDELRENYVYYKTSHHWSQQGAFLGWCQLGKAMFENGEVTDMAGFSSNAYVRTKSRFVRENFTMTDSVGVTAALYFGFSIPRAPANMLNADYLYYAPRECSGTKTKYKHDNYHCGFDFERPCGNDKRICVLGNSQSDQWDPFIWNSFKHARRVRFNAVGLYKGDLLEQSKLRKNFAKDIFDFRADVVVLCLGENDLGRLRNLMRED